MTYQLTIRYLAPLTVLLLAACASQPPPNPVDTAADLQVLVDSGEVVDDRGRFREIYCEVLDQHGPELPDYRSCENALRRIGLEAGAYGAPVSLAPSTANYLVLLVPGLGWNCFSDWLDLENSAPAHVAESGYELRTVPIDGLSSTASNAQIIRDYIAGLSGEDAGRPLILLGYSKGTPDILDAVANYPEVASRVTAVVSLAGAVHGSPLAENSTQAAANMLTMVPGSSCEEEDGDNDAVASLRPDVREQWLASHHLPASIRYFSVVTFPAPDRVSWVLENSYLLLGEKDSRNDTQVLIFDQIIPGSTLAAFVNADHWAIAVPVARSHPLIGGTLVNHNDYPREAFLEALLRYLEEDLGSGP